MQRMFSGKIRRDIQTLCTHKIKWLCRCKGLLSGSTAFDTTSHYLSPSLIRRNFGFVAVIYNHVFFFILGNSDNKQYPNF